MGAPPRPGAADALLVFTRSRWPARVFYVGVLLIATLWPFTPDTTPALVAERLARALSPRIAGRDAIDGARNLVLFGGWGLVWAVTGRGSLPRLLRNATFTGMCISLTVEVAQLFSRDRNASLLDVLSNTAGAFGGALALVVLALAVRARRDAKSYLGLPALTFAGGYATACMLEAFIPLFRQDTVLGAVGGPLHRLSVSLRAFELSSLLDPPVIDLFLFAPAGIFAVAALYEVGVDQHRGAGRTAIVGLVLAALVELAHGAIGLPISLGSIVAHGFAVALGAWIATRVLPVVARHLSGAPRVRAFLWMYAILMAWWSMRPFVPEFDTGVIAAKFDKRWWLPLGSLSSRVDFFSVVDVCSPFFLYLPLGALLAVWPLRRHGPLRGPLPAVYLAVALELSQFVIEGRLVDITDALVQASAALVGWSIIRRTGYPERGTVLHDGPPARNA